MNDQILSRIRDELRFVYGEPVASKIEGQLLHLIERFRPQLAGASASRRPWSEKDALLITYGDPVREENEPPLQTLKAFADRYLAGAISGIHILPFYPYSSDDGFSVIDYLAVNPALGSWEDVRRIGGRFDLMFDAVLNHVSSRSDWFQKFLRDDPSFRDYFVVVEGEPDLSQVVRPRALPLLSQFPTHTGPKKVWTTFSADQVDLNFRSPDVLLSVLETLLFYVTQGAGYIRLDAIAYLWKEIGTSCIHLPQTHALVRLMRALLDLLAPAVRLVTETNVPHRDNLSYFGDGRNEAQMVYNFALPPLVLHTLLTGNASALSGWAADLATSSRETAFFNFLASHDGIGVNPVRGLLSETEIAALVRRVQEHGGFISDKRNSDGSNSPYELNISFFDALSNPNESSQPVEVQVNRFMVAQSIMLTLAGVPGIYFHSLFGSRSDRAAAESSGIPRRINRQKLRRTELESELSDPRSLRARVFDRFKRLLVIRRDCAAFNPLGAQQVIASDPRVFALDRRSPDEQDRVLCLHNVSSAPVRWDLPRARENGTGWSDLISGAVPERRDDNHVILQPYEVLWLRPQ